MNFILQDRKPNEGTILFEGPEVKKKASPDKEKPKDIPVDLDGQVVSLRDLGLDKAKVMVKGAIITKDGKVIGSLLKLFSIFFVNAVFLAGNIINTLLHLWSQLALH